MLQNIDNNMSRKLHFDTLLLAHPDGTNTIDAAFWEFDAQCVQKLYIFLAVLEIKIKCVETNFNITLI